MKNVRGVWPTRLVLAGIAAVFGGSGALAQGAAFYAHGACTTARAGAGVGAPCEDGSAVAYNPAGLAALPSSASAGVSVVRLESRFTFDRTLETTEGTADAELVPSAFAAYRYGRLAAGVGVWAPYGLTTAWPVTFEGRYMGYRTAISGIYVQPTVAYEAVADRLWLGAGLDVVRGSVDLRRRLDLAVQEAHAELGIEFARLGVPVGTDFADAGLEGVGWAVTGHAGILARLSGRISVGARYLGPATIGVDDGRATFSPVATGLRLPRQNPLGLPAGTEVDDLVAGQFAGGGALAAQSLSTELTLPAQAAAGVRLGALDGFQLLLDYQWIGWSSFDAVELDFGVASDATLQLGWEDTHGVRAGAEYALRGGVLVRGGFAYNTAATPDRGVTPLLPEADRQTFTAGLELPLGDRLRLGAALERAVQADRRGRVRSPEDFFHLPIEELNVGVYEDTAAWLAVATLVYGLGGGP